MRRSVHDCQSGQTLVEYILIVAAIALACVGATIFLSGGINGIFESNRSTLGAFTPPASTVPVTPPELAEPKTIQDCRQGRWRDYPQFESEAACVKFVKELG